MKPAERNDSGSALWERVKELECLYAIAQASAKPDAAVPDVLQEVVDVLPAAWRFPQRAYAYIRFDGEHYLSDGNARASRVRVASPIRVHGKVRGEVAVGYASSPGGTTTFLSEERRLLAEVARQLGYVAERIEARREQEALREQLWHAERLITVGQLASGVAHERNEPLGCVLGFAQLIGKNAALPAKVRKDLGRIEAAALHARSIIQKLMLFTRQSSPSFGVVELNPLIRESVDLLKWRCEDLGIRVRYALGARLPTVIADEGQIRQVVINLVINAMHALADGGTLTVASKRRRSGVEISVADDGVGISPDVLPRIFDPFFTTKDIGKGTGLGLSIVHGIVAAHGGRVSVESKVGEGTRMDVRLPVGHGATGGHPRRQAVGHAD